MLVKTDNSYLEDKIQLRLGMLPAKDITVLDCYGGYGHIWKEIAKRFPHKIKRTGIDKEKRPHTLQGDNLKWLLSLDLSKYDVIDLDAYGIPYEQLRVLFRRGYRGVVFVTAIQSVMGQLPKRMLSDHGISGRAFSLCPTIWGKVGFELLLGYLAENGVESIRHRGYSRKHYFGFIM
jgi:hypothetical protein